MRLAIPFSHHAFCPKKGLFCAKGLLFLCTNDFFRKPNQKITWSARIDHFYCNLLTCDFSSSIFFFRSSSCISRIFRTRSSRSFCSAKVSETIEWRRIWIIDHFLSWIITHIIIHKWRRMRDTTQFRIWENSPTLEKCSLDAVATDCRNCPK